MFPSKSNEKTLSYESDNGGSGVLLINVVTFVMNKVVWEGVADPSEVVKGVVFTGILVSMLALEEVVKGAVFTGILVSMLALEVVKGTVFAGVVVSMLTLEVVRRGVVV